MDPQESSNSRLTVPEAESPTPPLQNCPLCRYSLQGLPRIHRCPECGFAYDEHTFASSPRSFWWFAWPVLILVCPQLFNTLNLLRLAWWWGAIFVASVLCGIAFIIVAYRRRPFVAATPEGLSYRRAIAVRTIPWAMIESFHRGTPRSRDLSVQIGKGKRISLGHLMASRADYTPLEVAARHYREHIMNTEPGAASGATDLSEQT